MENGSHSFENGKAKIKEPAQLDSGFHHALTAEREQS